MRRAAQVGYSYVPRFSSPKRRIMSPLRNADKMAKSGLVLTYRCTMSAIMAVGPVAGSVCPVWRKEDTCEHVEEKGKARQGIPSRVLQ